MKIKLFTISLFLLFLMNSCGSVGDGISGKKSSTGGQSGGTAGGPTGGTTVGKQAATVTLKIPIKLTQ